MLLRGARVDARACNLNMSLWLRKNAFCKTIFKERVRRVAAQITIKINVAVAVEIVRSARVAFYQLPKTAFPANNF